MSAFAAKHIYTSIVDFVLGKENPSLDSTKSSHFIPRDYPPCARLNPTVSLETFTNNPVSSPHSPIKQAASQVPAAAPLTVSARRFGPSEGNKSLLCFL